MRTGVARRRTCRVATDRPAAWDADRRSEPGESHDHPSPRGQVRSDTSRPASGERPAASRLGHPIGPKAVLHYCDDCQRRFYNKGWHAEACGSSNFHELAENPAYGPGNPDWHDDLERERRAREPEAMSPREGKAASSDGS